LGRSRRALDEDIYATPAESLIGDHILNRRYARMNRDRGNMMLLCTIFGSRAKSIGC